MLNGIITALCLIAFIGIVFWAYSKKRKERFEEASRLPLIEDDDNDNRWKS